MFQIELLSGGVFWVYDVDTVENMFLIYRDDNWNWIEMETCKPYYPPSDAIQIVRCKDCIYRIDGRCFSRTSFLNSPAVEPDNFCSWGATE